MKDQEIKLVTDSFSLLRSMLLAIPMFTVGVGSAHAELFLCPACVATYGVSAPFCCPDDYCCKSLPSVCASCRFCPDTYGRKPLPCSCNVTRYCPDDYCQKSLPTTTGSLAARWYKCWSVRQCDPPSAPHADGEKDCER